MQVKPLLQFVPDRAGREPFVGNDDPPADVVVPDECRVGGRINAVPGEDLGAYRLHELYVVGIQDRYFAASLYPGFVRIRRKVIDGACVLFQCAVDRDVVVCSGLGKVDLVELFSLCAALPYPLDLLSIL